MVKLSRRKSTAPRFLSVAALLGLAAMSPGVMAQVTPDVTVDATSAGTAFSRGVRGQAIPAVNVTRPQVANQIKAREVARGSNIRGWVGGLEAEIFNWKTRNDDPRRPTCVLRARRFNNAATRNDDPRRPTLEYLKDSRDYNAELVMTTNVRGLVEPDPDNAGKKRFYDTSIPTLTRLAADWVRYTNRIAQNYRRGSVITDSEDLRILSELRWASATPGDVFLPLLLPTEAAVPKVTYWEIGNEPRIGLVKSYGVTNGYTFWTRAEDATHKNDYAARYKSMTAAMKAQDPTIKVGPALEGPLNAIGDFSITEGEILDSVLRVQPDGTFLPVDFISYHPYQSMGDLNAATNPAGVTSILNTVYANQKGRVDRIHERIIKNGRNPNSIELLATEHNVSSWAYNEQVPEAQMAHALGVTETVFSFARFGLTAAHYWLYPYGNDDGTEFPVYHAYVGMRDHMGDTLLNTYSSGSNRVYTTRDSATGEIALWGLNFANATDATLNVAVSGLTGNKTITLKRLGALAGPTTLASANLPGYFVGGPTNEVGWTDTNLTGTNLSNFQLTLPAATVSVLVIQP